MRKFADMNMPVTTVDFALVTDLSMIAALWLVSAVIVNPVGEFPLIDDWSFARPVKDLLETGEYRPVAWGMMTQITHVLWGALFSLLGGFSFTTLRIATLTAALLGMFGMYVLVRDLRQSRFLALAAAASLGFNPIYYGLSHSFMTDVPFTSLLIWSVIFLGRNLTNDSNMHLLLGTVFAVSATLSRQLALCVPFAFAIMLFLTSRVAVRTTMRAITPTAACVSALWLFNYWLVVTDRPRPYLTGGYLVAMFEKYGLTVVSMHAALNAYLIFLYLGLFLIPVLLLATNAGFRSRGKIAGVLMLAGATILMLGAAFTQIPTLAKVIEFQGRGLFLPVDDRSNFLRPSGLGPLFLRDDFELHLNHVPPLPETFWMTVTVLGFLGALLLIVKISNFTADVAPRIARRTPIDGAQVLGLFALICALIYLPLYIVGYFWDRYLLPLIPLLTVTIVSASGPNALPSPGVATRLLRPATIALLIAFVVFAVAGTRDYLAWNRARWQALRDLMQTEHVDAKDIDGGFEFNGQYTFEPNYKGDSPRKSWWFVQGDTYQVGFGPVDGYSIIKEYTYYRWLPPGEQKIVAMKRSESVGALPRRTPSRN